MGAVPENVTIIGMDFDRQNLTKVLGAAGFQTGERTLFIWEGVTQYLTGEAVKGTLEYVSSASGAGSTIVFTYIRRGIIDGSDRPEWFGSFLSLANRLGSPLLFGLDRAELEQYCCDCGLELVEDVGAAEYQDRYLKPLGRQLNVFDGERAVYARVQCP